MKISENGIKLIKKYEGLRLQAYRAVSTEKYYTIGYGHYGSDVKKNMKITETKAEELLKKDLVKYENYINTYCIKNYKYNLSQNQFDALTSFVYNCGLYNLKQLCDYGRRDLTTISKKILLYNKSSGKILLGLIKRRKEEQKLFLKNNNDVNYYKKCTIKSQSIIECLKSVNEEDTSYNNRKKIAQKNGIMNYRGTAEQNIKMVELLKKGKLIK